MRLILASASPRRAELLRAAGFEFEIFSVDVDESVRAGESPEIYVRRLAMEKSARALGLVRPAAFDPSTRSGLPRAKPRGDAAQAREAGRYVSHAAGRYGSDTRRDDTVVVLGADTAVVVDGEILGKPQNEKDAARMLRRLSGRRHQVMTGMSLRTREREAGHVNVTIVEFSSLSDADVEWYVASGEGRDKAGGYAIQGLASRFIPCIDGSYSNVVGLPVAAVCELLGEIASGG